MKCKFRRARTSQNQNRQVDNQTVEGTVSKDGAVIASNPGVGVTKAGWHCGSAPDADGCCVDCPACWGTPPDGDCLCNYPDPGNVPEETEEDLGDCHVRTCDPAGGEIRVIDDSDQPDDTTAPGDCMKTGCINGEVRPVHDDDDKPIVSDLETASNFCKTCLLGNIIPDKAKDGILIGTGCLACKNGSFDRLSDEILDEMCGQNMCGNPCSVTDGSEYLRTTESSCWAVKEDGNLICYRDYWSNDLPDKSNSVCCGGGCDSPDTRISWIEDSIGSYQCTVAEVCSEDVANECEGRSGF